MLLTLFSSSLTEKKHNNVEGSAAEETVSLGDLFLQWLTEGLQQDRIVINQENARVHSVAGFLFLCVPDIFYLFIKENNPEEDRRQVQTAFEKLGLHRVREGQRFTHARCYNTPAHEGKFQQLNGYLLEARHCYGEAVPDDSLYLVLP